MKQLQTRSAKAKPNYTILAALLLSLAALLIAIYGRDTTPRNEYESSLDNIQSTKILRVGYEGYPPYVVKNPATGEVTGYSVEMAEYIAQATGWELKWIETTPETKIPDLQANRFDIMVEPIYMTIDRATRVTFTEPYSYFGYAAGIVRKGDSRFSTISDINRPDITVSVRLGYTDQSYAEMNLPEANLRPLDVQSIDQLFLDVIAGNADIALSDVEQIKAYAQEHSNQVTPLWTESPPASVPAGFMLKQGDFELYNFLNAAIRFMKTNKFLRTLDEKYKVTVIHSEG